MPAITSIRHAGIVVRDLDASLKLYQGILGLEIYMRRTEEGEFIDRLTGLSAVKLEWVKLVIPKGGLIELLKYHVPADAATSSTPRPDSSNRLGVSHVALTATNLDAIYAAMQKEGYTCKSAPLISPNGKAKILHAHDPDGCILELIEDI